MQTLNKRRQAEQAESAANRLGPKGNGVGTRAIDFLVMGKRKMKPTFPAKRADLICQVTQEERGKPDTPPRRGQVIRKENRWGGGQRIVEKAKAVL